MAKVGTYNSKKVTVTLGDNHIVAGLADDSFVQIESAGEGIQYLVGADGEVSRSIDPSEVYTVKLTLLQSSATNNWLDKMYKKDRTDGSGIFSISIKDILGGDKFSGSQAWVSKPATWQRGKQTSNREWEIVVADGDLVIV